MQQNKPLELTVKSCGVDREGRSIIRAYADDGKEYIIPTDHRTFAVLAAAGMRVLFE